MITWKLPGFDQAIDNVNGGTGSLMLGDALLGSVDAGLLGS